MHNTVYKTSSTIQYSRYVSSEEVQNPAALNFPASSVKLSQEYLAKFWKVFHLDSLLLRLQLVFLPFKELCHDIEFAFSDADTVYNSRSKYKNHYWFSNMLYIYMIPRGTTASLMNHVVEKTFKQISKLGSIMLLFCIYPSIPPIPAPIN